MAPHISARLLPYMRLLLLLPKLTPLDLVPLLLEAVHDARAQPALVDDDQRGLVLLDGVDDVADHFHRVVAAVAA
jgi:hypothetical protein